MLLKKFKQNYWRWRGDLSDFGPGAVITSIFHRAGFSSMAQSTAEDWSLIAVHARRFERKLADRVLTHLQLLKGRARGFPVDRFQHSLQTATHAFKSGEDEEYVVCALLHDIGDTIGTLNHADIAAAILKPFVSRENLWMIENHTIFQGYYYLNHFGRDRNSRDQFKDHPCFQKTVDFCEKYDNTAFDPKMRSMPLKAFEPMVRRVFANPRNSTY
jgi:predicted HD phosphohydrolase